MSESSSSDFIPSGFKSIKNFSLQKLSSVGIMVSPGDNEHLLKEIEALRMKIKELEDKLKFENVVVRKSMDSLCLANEEMERELDYYRKVACKESNSGKPCEELKELRAIIKDRDLSLKLLRDDSLTFEGERFKLKLEVEALRREMEEKSIVCEESSRKLQSELIREREEKCRLKEELLGSKKIIAEIKSSNNERMSIASETVENLKAKEEWRSKEIASLREKIKHFECSDVEAKTVCVENSNLKTLIEEYKQTIKESHRITDSHRKSLNESVVEKEELKNKYLSEISTLKETHEYEMNEMSRQADKVLAEWELSKMKFEKTIEDVTEKKKSLSKNVDKLEGMLEESRKCCKVNDRELVEMRTEVKTLKENLKKNAELYRDHIKTLEAKIEECSSENVLLVQECSCLKNKIDVLSQSTKDVKLESQIKERKGSDMVKDLKKQLKSSFATIDKLKEQLVGSQDECLVLKQNISASVDEQGIKSKNGKQSQIDTETLLRENALLIERISELQCKSWSSEDFISEAKETNGLLMKEIARKDEVIQLLLSKMPCSVEEKQSSVLGWKLSTPALQKVLDKSLMSFLQTTTARENAITKKLQTDS